MTNLKNILTIAGLGLVTSLNAQTSKQIGKNKFEFYNSKGQLEKVIIKGNTGEYKDSIDYKYNENGLLIEKFQKRYLPSGGSEIYQEERTKFNETGQEIEKLWQEDSDNDGKFDRRSKKNYNYSNGFLEKIIQQRDFDGDGIYEQPYECPCGSKKEAI